MPHTFVLEGTDIKYKKAGKGNASSSRVNLPKSWEGCDVAIVKLEKKHD